MCRRSVRVCARQKMAGVHSGKTCVYKRICRFMLMFVSVYGNVYVLLLIYMIELQAFPSSITATTPLAGFVLTGDSGDFLSPANSQRSACFFRWLNHVKTTTNLTNSTLKAMYNHQGSETNDDWRLAAFVNVEEPLGSVILTHGESGQFGKQGAIGPAICGLMILNHKWA